MEKKERCFELRTTEGNPIIRVIVCEVPVSGPAPASPEKTGANGGKERPGVQDAAPMTEAQKRYLFRILADKGYEGDKAYDYLKEHLQVDTLKEVTKAEASKMIENLLDNGKGGKTNGSPLQ